MIINNLAYVQLTSCCWELFIWISSLTKWYTNREIDGRFPYGSLDKRAMNHEPEKVPNGTPFHSQMPRDEIDSSVSEGDSYLLYISVASSPLIGSNFSIHFNLEGPGIENFQIIGDAVPGDKLLGCGYQVRGTSLCMFQVKFLVTDPNGTLYLLKISINTNTLCSFYSLRGYCCLYFQWVRHLQDGTRQYIEG